VRPVTWWCGIFAEGHPQCIGEEAIPATHRDLLERPIVAALSTRLPDGWAQTQPVWC
jgi:hypothetical protein